MSRLFGKGSKKKVGKNLWRLEVSTGKNPAAKQNERQYGRMRETFKGTSSQADKRLEEMTTLAESGVNPDGFKMTYVQVSDELLTRIEQRGVNKRTGKPLTNKTKLDYRTTEKHIIATFLAKMRISDIYGTHITKLLDELSSYLGATSVHKCYAQMRRVFEYARKQRYISFNPCDEIDESAKPVKPKTNKHALEKTEIRALVNYVLAHEPNPVRVGVLLSISNGLRLGEVLGLSWVHVVFDAPQPYLRINQQYTETDAEHHTKTDEEHITPLDNATVQYLKWWSAVQTQELNSLGIERGTQTPICSTATGGRIAPSNFEKMWHSFSVEAGLGRYVNENGMPFITLTLGDDSSLYDGYYILWQDKDGVSCDENGRRFSRSNKKPKVSKKYEGWCFHELRHSWTTLLAENGVEFSTIAKMGGWANQRVPQEIYTHIHESKILSSGGHIDALLGAGNGNAISQRFPKY